MDSIACRGVAAGPISTGIDQRAGSTGAVAPPIVMTRTLPPIASTRRGPADGAARCRCSTAACFGVRMSLTLIPERIPE